MKKSILFAAVATAASSGAYAFDSAPIQFDGRAGQYFHTIMQESIAGGYCGAFCNPAAPSTETQRISTTNDITDASGNFTLNNSNRTITCVDASGNGLDQLLVDSNNFTTVGGWNYTEGGSRNIPLGSGIYNSCNLQLGPDGSIDGGFSHVTAVSNIPMVGPVQFDPIVDHDRRGMMTIAACTGALNVPQAFALWDLALAAGLENGAAVGAIVAANPLDNGCLVSGWQYMSYQTCDIEYECGQFGKSVPVPAFAAGLLGLGLMGITFLTSQRRSIR